tara:strand:+ start:33 stop:533 length:501 start_codon:yes stop_codon:yes gene_type:complete
MWVVAKVKYHEVNTFKRELKNKFDDQLIFYYPKIQLENIVNGKIKIRNKTLLENYIFCFHKNFKEKNNINQLQFIKGLIFFLDGHELNQNQIITFIKHCKNFENNLGFIRSSFFKSLLSKRAKFISGPFTNMFFDIIEKQKNKLKIVIKDIITTVPDNKNYLYQPV